MPFLIGALRAIVEMLGLCLIAQALLGLLAGQKRHNNPIYQLFSLITRAPLRLVAHMLPRLGQKTIGIISFLALFFIWIGLAVLRKLI